MLNLVVTRRIHQLQMDPGFRVVCHLVAMARTSDRLVLEVHSGDREVQ
jgi:hypothetical protein